MKLIKTFTIATLVLVAACEYPYIFGNSVNTKGIANGQGNEGITGSQTTVYGLDDVSESTAYANGTNESNSRTDGEAIWTPRLHGANSNADAVNNGTGNALADSVSKSFVPSWQYWKQNYADYIRELNELYLNCPEKREAILKVIVNMNNCIKEDQEVRVRFTEPSQAAVERAQWAQTRGPTANGYPKTIANIGNPEFESIGQTTFDQQRARGSGDNTSASTNSGTFRWSGATVHQGEATGNAADGWATSSSNYNGLGKVNYQNTEENAGANGTNAQTNSNSNQYLAQGAVWSNGESSARAEGDDSLAFTNINANSHGYGASEGDTQSYTDGDLSVSQSQVKSAPYLGGSKRAVLIGDAN